VSGIINWTILEEAVASYRLDRSEMRNTAQRFQQEMDLALAGKNSSLKMLPSFLAAPSGHERGNYTAIDLGGSNLRVMQIELLGQGQYRIIKQISRSLQDPQGGYDYTAPEINGQQIFGFIAEMTAKVMEGAESQGLGFTFSYPMNQQKVDSGRLIRWTKEFNPRDTIGRDVADMLSRALWLKGIEIRPSAIINDTAAVFLAGCYQDSSVCAGSICGTGHNTCVLDPHSLVGARCQPMIVNMEAGNFSRLPLNCWDRILNQDTEDPGQQIMEKMVSGKYLGELLRITLRETGEKGVWSGYDRELRIWTQPYSVDTRVLGWLYSDQVVNKELLDHWMELNGIPLSEENHQMITRWGRAIIQRAIKLLAASYMAVIKHSRQFNQPGWVIAVDGALFKYLPGFMSGIEDILQEEFPPQTVGLTYIDDGSSVGAAVAAALTK